MKAGIVEPQKHKKWARRKFSMMLSVMPDAYTFSEEKYKLEIIPEKDK